MLRMLRLEIDAELNLTLSHVQLKVV